MEMAPVRSLSLILGMVWAMLAHSRSPFPDRLFAWRRMKLDSQIVGNAGLYFTCYHLSLLGWNAMPTARNARGIDIVAYRRDGDEYLGLQVKSLSKRNPVPLGTSLGKLMGDFWVIVNKVTSEPTAFILTPDEVRQRAHRGEKDGKISFWLQPNAYDVNEFRGAWERIGRGDGLA